MSHVRIVVAGLLLAAVVGSLASRTAFAADTWILSGTGAWEDGINWSNGNQPSTGDTTTIGNSSVSGTAQITLSGEVVRSLILASSATSSGTLDILSGSFQSGRHETDPTWIGQTGYVAVGNSGTGVVNQSGGSVTVGFDDTSLPELRISVNSNSSGTYNLSGPSTTTLHAGDLVFGDGTTALFNQTGGTATFDGGVTSGSGPSELRVDDGTMTVADGFDVKTLRVGYEGGTGTLTVNGGAVTVGTGSNDLFIGLRDTGDDPTLGTVDFGSASSVHLDLNRLHLGTDTTGDTSSGNKSVVGILTLSSTGSNTIDATAVLLGSTSSAQNTPVISELHLGGATNTINTDTFTVGGFKSAGLVDIVAGGELILGGKSGSKTALRIGYNAQDTGTNPVESVLDLSGGTFNATLSTLEIGRHDRGSGSGKGQLILEAGNVTADSITLAKVSATGTSSNPANTTGKLQVNGGSIVVSGSVTDGGGTSTINLDNGTMSVGGDLSVDTLRVGYLPSGVSVARSATLTVAGGGNVAIGSATNRTNLYLGYNTAGNDYDATGTLDLSGATQFDAYLGKLSLGEVTVSGDLDGNGRGILTLPATSNIDAQEILVSWSASYGQTQPTSTIELGTTSNFNVDTFTVGGFRGFALVEFATTGTLNLAGSSGTEADLLIANSPSTNYATNGHMDMSGGTLNATLDQLLIGYDGGGHNTATVGKLTFNAGSVSANSLTLGDAAGSGSGAGQGEGTLNMSGGSLTVNGNTTLGTGTSYSSGTINLSGGTIDVVGNVTGGIGTSTVNFDGGTMTVGGDLAVDVLRVGYNNTNATMTVNGASAQIGAGAGTALNIGTRNADGSGFTGTLDLSSVTNVDIDVETVTLGNTDAGTTNQAKGVLNLGAVNTIKADNVYVGRRKGTGEVDIAAAGTLQIGEATDRSNLYIGYNDVNTSATATGTVDLSGGSEFTAYLDNLEIGVRLTSGSSGNAQGTLTLADTNMIDAKTILISHSEMWVDLLQSTLRLGNDNTIKTDTFTVGASRATALVEFAAPGGVLNLVGSTDAAADLEIAVCRYTTGNRSIGTMDLTGGTFNATLDSLRIGYKPARDGQSPTATGVLSFDAGDVTANSVIIGEGVSTGSGDGRGIGTLNMGGGTFAANSIQLAIGTSVGSEGTINLSGGAMNVSTDVTGGVGTSTVNVTGSGALTVAGTIDVDDLTLNGSTATIDAGTIDLSSGGTFAFLDGTLHVDQFNGDLVQDGGLLAPGNSPGTTYVTGDYTMNAGTLQIEIEGTDPGTGYDQLVVDGNVSLAGSLEVLVSGYGTTSNDLFWIIDNTGSTTTTTGQFDGIAQGESVVIDGRYFYVYYDADYENLAFTGGNDVLLTSVPEPSTVAALLGLGVMGLLGYLRRRRRS